MLGLAVVVAAGHAGVLGSRATALDDEVFLVQNPLVLHPSTAGVARVFSEVLAPSTVSAYYLPLSMTSLMLDAALGGSPERLLPFHVTSLALHVAAALFLFLLLEALLGATGSAALGALLWGLHPLGVEAIASVGERKTVLATALAFASAWAYVRSVTGGGARWRWGSVLAFALSLLSKPSVVTLPLGLLVLDAWPLRRASWRAVAEKWAYLLLAGIVGVISVVAVKRTWEFVAPPPLDLAKLALQVSWLPGFYLGKVLWPSHLTTIYEPPAPFHPAQPEVAAGLALAVGLAAAGWAFRRRAPALGAGALLFLVLLLPTFGILRFSDVIAYDRYVYLPGAGLALAFAGCVLAPWRRGGAMRTALLATALAVAAAEGVATHATIGHWSDSLTHWRRAVRLAPGMAAAHNGLGARLSQMEDHEGAIRAFRDAVAVQPGYADGWLNLGRELWLTGRNAEAIAPLDTAVALTPGSPKAAVQHGQVLLALGRTPEGLAEIRRALALRPDHAPALRLLGMGLVTEGRGEEGLAYLRRSVEQDPEDAKGHLALAVGLRAVRGASPEVVGLLRRAVELAPGAVPAMNELAWLRATAPDSTLRDSALALEWSARALAAEPTPTANLLDTRAAALGSARRFSEAIEVAERALALTVESGDDSLAAQVRQRLKGYRQQHAFVDDGGGGH